MLGILHMPFPLDISVASQVLKEETESEQTMSRIQDSSPRSLTKEMGVLPASDIMSWGLNMARRGWEKRDRQPGHQSTFASNWLSDLGQVT